MRMTRMAAVCGLVLGVLCGGGALAEEWIILGPRALGMGGAGVAAVDDASAAYWNPAAISRGSLLGVQIDFGASVAAEGDILREIDELYDAVSEPGPNGYDLDAALTVLDDPAATQADKADALADILVAIGQVDELGGDGEGVVATTHAALQVQFAHFGFAVSGYIYAGIGPYLNLDSSAGWNLVQGEVDVRDQLETMFGAPLNDPSIGDQIPVDTPLVDDIEAILIAADPGLNDIDGSARNAANELVAAAEAEGIDTSDPTIRTILTNIAQGTADAATGGATDDVFGDNAGAILRGIQVYEYRVSYVNRIIAGMAVGINLKALQGETRYLKYSSTDLKEGDDIVSDIDEDKNAKSSTEFDADIGLLFSPMPRMMVGLVARHVLNPKFKFSSAETGISSLKLDTQMRAGVAVRPIRQLTIAMDADLTENESDVLDGYKSQQVCLGIEFRPVSFFALRAGAYDNTASSESDWVYTAGIGIRSPVFAFEIAAAQSSNETEIEAGGDAEKIRDLYAFSAVLRFGKTF